MTHVKYTKTGCQPARLEIDGEDWSEKVYAEGFNITIPEDFARQATVTVVIPVDELEVDLPDVMLEALSLGNARLARRSAARQ